MKRQEKCERLADELRRTKAAIENIVLSPTEHEATTYHVRFGTPHVRSRKLKSGAKQQYVTVPEDWLETVYEAGLASPALSAYNPTKHILVLYAEPAFMGGSDDALDCRAWHVVIASAPDSWKLWANRTSLVEYQGVWVIRPTWKQAYEAAKDVFMQALVPADESAYIGAEL